jgi:hypothetical protein
MSTQKKVVDARQDADGNISHVLFEGNQNYTSIDRAVGMADKGKIENAHAVHPKGRKSHLRSNPDSKTANNLDSMAEN